MDPITLNRLTCSFLQTQNPSLGKKTQKKKKKQKTNKKTSKVE
jgi:hypothetical protein